MVLNGWILKHFEQNGRPGTWCHYYLQIDPHGLTPFPLATKMVSKRLVHIYKIEDYLKKNGTPRSAGTGQNVQRANGNAIAAGGVAATGNSVQKDGAKSAEDSGWGLPPQMPFDKTHASASAVLQAKEKLNQLLSSGTQWDKAVDPRGNPLYTQAVQGSNLPIMKGEANLPSGITTEQVLGTVLSPAARQIWNEYLLSTQLLESINGTEQCIHKDTYKGIHPHIPNRAYTLAQGVFRTEGSSDNGDITCVGTSSNGGKADITDSENSNGSLDCTLDYAGWQISSSASSSDKVRLVNAIKLNLEKPDLPEFIKRILIVAYAGAPAKVGEYISKYGHAPYFLRWSPGKAILQGETDASDPRNGKFGWKIGKSAKSIESTLAEQVAWLQYSSTMYRKSDTAVTGALRLTDEKFCLADFETFFSKWHRAAIERIKRCFECG